MAKLKITLSQKLNDGDTALVEEHNHVDPYYAQDIIAEYQKRALSKSYVDSFNVSVTIEH